MKVKFKEIALMLSGVYMKTDPSGDIGYWQIKDVSKENGFNYEQLSMVVDNGKISNYLLRPGDLLFSSKGLSNYCVMYHGEGGKTMAFIVSIMSIFCCIMAIKSTVNHCAYPTKLKIQDSVFFGFVIIGYIFMILDLL